VLISLADENFVADALPPSGLDDTLRACAIERLANTDAMVIFKGGYVVKEESSDQNGRIERIK